MTDTPQDTGRPFTGLWLSLRYHDALAGIEFLVTAFGFERAVVHVADDGVTVEHAELRWPFGGGVMLGSASNESSAWPQRAGHAGAYVVTDEPDALFERAVAAGATVTQELYDTDYGSREFAVRDPEGNLWSFGTYAGESTST